MRPRSMAPIGVRVSTEAPTVPLPQLHRQVALLIRSVSQRLAVGGSLLASELTTQTGRRVACNGGPVPSRAFVLCSRALPQCAARAEIERFCCRIDAEISRHPHHRTGSADLV